MSLDCTDNYLKDENYDEELQSEFKTVNCGNRLSTDTETKACKTEINENIINEEINNLHGSHLDSYLVSPSANSVSDSEHYEIEENTQDKIIKKVSVCSFG